MVWFFGSSVGNVPQELSLPLKGLPDSKTGEELVRAFQSWYPDSILCSLPKGNFLALSSQDESAMYLRYLVSVLRFLLRRIMYHLEIVSDLVEF